MTLVLALIAHDSRKAEMIAFAQHHAVILAAHHLIATGTTGKLIQAATGLSVEQLQSGPLGGDAQIAARVVERNVDAVIFLVDPLYSQPHQADVATLQRLCNLYNVPLATNLSTAEILAQHLARSTYQNTERFKPMKHLEKDTSESILTAVPGAALSLVRVPACGEAS